MYAIVDIAGQQFKVEKNQKIFVHRLDAEEGSKVDFERVLLIDNDGKIQVGSPVIKNTIVTASVISHIKGDKLRVFKKKKRKGYQVMNGHRQSFTEILIENIGEGTPRPDQAKKTETRAVPKAPASDVKTAEKPKATADEKKETVTAKKSTAKTTTKKPVAKTATAAAKPAAKTSAKPAAKPAAKKTAAKPATKKAATKPAAKKPVAKTTAKTKKTGDK